MITDGTSLLGADDKAGVVEIMEAVKYLQTHPEIKHGRIRIAFTPDEEIGRGPLNLMWNALMPISPILWMAVSLENYNSKVLMQQKQQSLHGVNVHPGSAKTLWLMLLD